jgi:lipopolysaccharide/colanic/teichoic acid biosynthesis glycosyltransferase
MTAEELQQHYADVTDILLAIPPGLTGLWQVMGRDRLSRAQRRRLDLFFAQRCTRALYLQILWRTIAEVWHGRDAS